MWILVQKKKLDAIPHSTKACQCQHASVVKKKKPNKTNKQKIKVGGGGVVLVLFFSLPGVMWPPPWPSRQNKARNWVWACPLSPLFDGKGWIGKGEKKKKGCFALPHLCTFTEGDCINRERNVLPPLRHFWSSNVGQMKALFYWSDEVHLERQRGFKSYWNKARRRYRLAMQAGGWQSFNLHRSADKSTPEFHF